MGHDSGHSAFLRRNDVNRHTPVGSSLRTQEAIVDHQEKRKNSNTVDLPRHLVA